MFTDRTPVPDKQLHRWLDDGGAQPPGTTMRGVSHRAAADPEWVVPVTWSPSALNARLDAEQALRALPRRTHGIAADARTGVRRIVSEVDRRQVTLPAATDRLRALTARLRQHRHIEDAAARPRAWQLLTRGGASAKPA